MAMITFRIDDSVRDQLHDLAEGRGVSVSDVLRSLIVGVLDEGGEGDGPSRYVVPESMTVVERKQLSLLHKILARLVDDQSGDNRLGHDGDTAYQLDRAQALEEGWTREYGVEFDAMQSEVSRRDCGLVMDVLDMFRVLQESVAAADGQLSADETEQLSFAGFDQGDPLERRLLEYARWLVSDSDRWADHAAAFSEEHDGGDTGRPQLPGYQRMLERYESIRRSAADRSGRRRDLLTADELKRIARVGRRNR